MTADLFLGSFFYLGPRDSPWMSHSPTSWHLDIINHIISDMKCYTNMNCLNGSTYTMEWVHKLCTVTIIHSSAILHTVLLERKLANTIQLRKLGKSYHMLPILVQPKQESSYAEGVKPNSVAVSGPRERGCSPFRITPE